MIFTVLTSALAGFGALVLFGPIGGAVGVILGAAGGLIAGRIDARGAAR